MPRAKIPLVSPGQLSLSDLKPKLFPLLPDPWTLPVDKVSEIKSRPQQTTQIKQKPLLLLPQANEIRVQALATTVEPPLHELYSDINIDTLQLRRARKIAKALDIAQKVNKKDQPISWLRAQIKAKLQQPQALPPEAIKALRELAS